MPLTSATNIELYGMMGDGHDSLIPVTVAIKVPVAAIKKGVCLQNTSKSHSYHLKIWYLLFLLLFIHG